MAGQATVNAALTVTAIALGVFVVWNLLARFLERRAPDSVFLALLVFQLFFLFRYLNTFLPSAGPFNLAGLSPPQKMTAILQVATLVFAALWFSRINSTAPEHSAPSRVMGFLRRRRMPARILGLICMAVAIGATYWTATNPPAEILSTPHWQSPPLIFGLWLACDAFYLAGRALWMRVH